MISYQALGSGSGELLSASWLPEGRKCLAHSAQAVILFQRANFFVEKFGSREDSTYVIAFNVPHVIYKIRLAFQIKELSI